MNSLAIAAMMAPIVLLLGGGADVAAQSHSSPEYVTRSVRLHGHDLAVRLVAGRTYPAPLIVYATSDAGWRGKDTATFHTLTSWGYPAAGISSPDYVHHLDRGQRALRPEDVASDVSAIIATADAALDLPASEPVVLVGKSRGAGLVVAAGSAATFDGRLRGILAVALTGDEEHVSTGAGALDTYAVLPQLGDTPIAVIQSTKDKYLPAAKARERFGFDTRTRRFDAIAANDHDFGGALPALYEDMALSFAWIIAR
jgi:predicted alpha/beta hydrolase family esterase